MQKRSLWIITIILSFTLICLILVQAYWINNAIKIKEDQFQQLVNKGLDNIVKEIENREMVYQVVNEMEPYQDVSPSGHPSINYHSNRMVQSVFGLSATDEEKEVFVIHNTDSLNISSQLKLLGSNVMQLNKKSAFQFDNASKQESFGNLKLNIDFNEKLNNRTVFVENVVNKLIQIDVDIEDRIDKETIDQIINNAFQELGIDMRPEGMSEGENQDNVEGQESGNNGDRPNFEQMQNMSQEEREKFMAERMASGGTGNRPANMGRAMARVEGEIISQDETSITIKLKDGGSKIVFLTEETKFFEPKE